MTKWQEFHVIYINDFRNPAAFRNNNYGPLRGIPQLLLARTCVIHGRAHEVRFHTHALEHSKNAPGHDDARHQCKQLKLVSLEKDHRWGAGTVLWRASMKYFAPSASLLFHIHVVTIKQSRKKRQGRKSTLMSERYSERERDGKCNRLVKFACPGYAANHTKMAG